MLSFHQELLYSKKTRRRRDARLFPEESVEIAVHDDHEVESHSRVRRSVESGGSSEPISMNLGHYREVNNIGACLGYRELSIIKFRNDYRCIPSLLLMH